MFILALIVLLVLVLVLAFGVQDMLRTWKNDMPHERGAKLGSISLIVFCIILITAGAR